MTKLYHATHKDLVPKILREGLKSNRNGFVYVARTMKSALEQCTDDPPMEIWKGHGITYPNLRLCNRVPKEDIVILEISGLTKGDLDPDLEQWNMDEDLATRKSIPAKDIRVVFPMVNR